MTSTQGAPPQGGGGGGGGGEATAIQDNLIVNADVNSAAAIAYSKLAALTSGNILVGNGSNVATSVAMSGDVNISNTGATTIQANSVDGTMIAMGSDAQGDVMYYDGTNWVRLGAGTSGHFLKTQGAGANPVWAAAAGGSSDIDKITGGNGSTTATSIQELDTYTFSASDLAATDVLIVHILGVKDSGANNGEFQLRIADGTNTTTTPVSTTASNVMAKLMVWQNPSTSESSIAGFSGSSGGFNEWIDVRNTQIANWITSAWTISLRGRAISSNTWTWNWGVFRFTST